MNDEKLFDHEGSEYKGDRSKIWTDGTRVKRYWYDRKKVCDRCGGRGVGPWLQDGGICYKCMGKGDLGWESIRLYTEAELKIVTDKEKARRLKRMEREAEKYKAALELLEETYRDLFAEAEKYFGVDAFIEDVVKTIRLYASASNKQIEALKKAIQVAAERAERKKEKGKAPSGRQTINAVIIGTKKVDSPWGVQYKMLVELDSQATAYGSIPSSLLTGMFFDGFKGSTVEFTADFTRADGDDTHAFFKRPTKARRIVSEQA